MSRSAKKGPYIYEKLYKWAADESLGTAQKPIHTYARWSVIPPQLVNKWVEIHNGKGFTMVFIKEDMVGHLLGEFASTRTFKGHGQIVKRLMTKT